MPVDMSDPVGDLHRAAEMATEAILRIGEALAAGGAQPAKVLNRISAARQVLMSADHELQSLASALAVRVQAADATRPSQSWVGGTCRRCGTRVFVRRDDLIGGSTICPGCRVWLALG